MAKRKNPAAGALGRRGGKAAAGKAQAARWAGTTAEERRAIMRIRLNFGSGGALGASCSTETASGQQEACFGQQQGSGRWSLTGSTLCVAAAVINLSSNTCYQVSGSGNQLQLSGPGILSGSMFLQ